jgi:hypothetical protein
MVASASFRFGTAEVLFLAALVRGRAREAEVEDVERRVAAAERRLRLLRELPADRDLPRLLEALRLRDDRPVKLVSLIMLGIMAPTSSPRPSPIAPSSIGLLSAIC